MIDEVLPIDEYEEKYFENLSKDFKNHIENFVQDKDEAYDLKRLIFISLRQYINEFDDSETTAPNLGINDDSMCANRYRKISRQVFCL